MDFNEPIDVFYNKIKEYFDKREGDRCGSKADTTAIRAIAKEVGIEIFIVAHYTNALADNVTGIHIIGDDVDDTIDVTLQYNYFTGELT